MSREHWEEQQAEQLVTKVQTLIKLGEEFQKMTMLDDISEDDATEWLQRQMNALDIHVVPEQQSWYDNGQFDKYGEAMIKLVEKRVRAISCSLHPDKADSEKNQSVF